MMPEDRFLAARMQSRIAAEASMGEPARGSRPSAGGLQQTAEQMAGLTGGSAPSVGGAAPAAVDPRLAGGLQQTAGRPTVGSSSVPAPMTRRAAEEAREMAELQEALRRSVLEQRPGDAMELEPGPNVQVGGASSSSAVPVPMVLPPKAPPPAGPPSWPPPPSEPPVFQGRPGQSQGSEAEAQGRRWSATDRGATPCPPTLPPSLPPAAYMPPSTDRVGDPWAHQARASVLEEAAASLQGASVVPSSGAVAAGLVGGLQQTAGQPAAGVPPPPPLPPGYRELPFAPASRAGTWRAALQMLLTALIAVFEPGVGLSWAVTQKSHEDALQVAEDLASRHGFEPRPSIRRVQGLCDGAEHRELPMVVAASRLPVLVVGDSVIATRGAGGKRSMLGDWKQNRHWDLEVQAHEGKGYASLSRAIRQGDRSRALVVYWMLNDCVYSSKSTDQWVWFERPDIEQRAATIAAEMRAYARAIVVCGATGEYWDIRYADKYNETVDKCIRVFKSWGIHAIRHMVCWESISDKRTPDKKHFRADDLPDWYPHFESLLQLIQLADLVSGTLSPDRIMRIPEAQWLVDEQGDKSLSDAMWETPLVAPEQVAAAIQQASQLPATSAASLLQPSQSTAWDGLGLTVGNLPSSREIVRLSLARAVSPAEVLVELLRGNYERYYSLSSERLQWIDDDLLLLRRKDLPLVLDPLRQGRHRVCTSEATRPAA